jgi:hypothetical protein
MFTQVQKTIASNTKLAQDVASTLTAASFAYGRTVVDVNTKIAEAVKAQATEAYKSVEGFKMPQSFEDFKFLGFEQVAEQFSKTVEQFTPKATKAKAKKAEVVDAE